MHPQQELADASNAVRPVARQQLGAEQRPVDEVIALLILMGEQAGTQGNHTMRRRGTTRWWPILRASRALCVHHGCHAEVALVPHATKTFKMICVQGVPS